MPEWEGKDVYCGSHGWLILMDKEGIVRHATHGTLCELVPKRRIPVSIEDRRQRALEAGHDGGDDTGTQPDMELAIEIATQVVITNDAIEAFLKTRAAGLAGRLAAALTALGLEVVDIEPYRS